MVLWMWCLSVMLRMCGSIISYHSSIKVDSKGQVLQRGQSLDKSMESDRKEDSIAIRGDGNAGVDSVIAYL